jgi:hypothetical protein
MLQKQDEYKQFKKIWKSYHANYYDKVAYFSDITNSTKYLSECSNSVGNHMWKLNEHSDVGRKCLL